MTNGTKSLQSSALRKKPAASSMRPACMNKSAAHLTIPAISSQDSSASALEIRNSLKRG